MISRSHAACVSGHHQDVVDVVRPVGAQRLRVEVRTYPREDEVFRDLVLEELRRFDRVRRVAAIPGRLEGRLADRFPGARCRYQHPLASDHDTPVLYAFRDGAWTP